MTPGKEDGVWDGTKEDSPRTLAEMRPLMREVSVESHQLDIAMLKITSAGLRMQLHWQHACLALLRPGVSPPSTSLKPCVAAHACNPSTQEIGAVGSEEVQSHPQLSEQETLPQTKQGQEKPFRALEEVNPLLTFKSEEWAYFQDGATLSQSQSYTNSNLYGIEPLLQDQGWLRNHQPLQN